ncbi:MAG: PfkB family carbohydrate kinase, partial [Beijerinckiaceae bacterium]
MPVRLLGLGDNTVDTYIDRGEQYPGGNAVNVAVLAQQRGAQAAYCGCLGNDEAADIVRAALDAEGIDVSHCRHCDAPNARAYITHQNGDRRFIRSEAGCRAAWGDFSSADESYINGFDCVHSSIFSGLDQARAQLRGAIQCWSFDFSEKWNRENLTAWLPSLDYVFLSHPQGTDQETTDLARHCASFGAQCIVITRGNRAALAWQDGHAAWRTPA